MLTCGALHVPLEVFSPNQNRVQPLPYLNLHEHPPHCSCRGSQRCELLSNVRQRFLTNRASRKARGTARTENMALLAGQLDGIVEETVADFAFELIHNTRPDIRAADVFEDQTRQLRFRDNAPS